MITIIRLINTSITSQSHHSSRLCLTSLLQLTSTLAPLELSLHISKYVTHLLRSFHWLRIVFRWKFKVLTVSYTAVSNLMFCVSPFRLHFL